MKEGLKLAEKSGALLLSVRVQPRASANEIVGVHDGALKVRLTAPPVDNRANRQLLEFLAARLAVPGKNLSLVRGKRSRMKQVAIRGISTEKLLNILIPKP